MILQLTAKAVSTIELFMTPLEFLLNLKKISPGTQLGMAHLGAIFEMLSPVIIRKPSPNYSPSLSARLTNETALAEWLGEPIATIEQWRIQGLPSASIKYRLGSVYDWIIAHIVPMFSAPVNAKNQSDVDLGDLAETWQMQIPVMKVDDQLIGFFRSVRAECEPSQYSLVEIPTLSFHPSEMTKETISSINESLIAHGEFSVAIVESAVDARGIYDKWKDIAMPEVLLQFFRSALLHNEELAKAIASELKPELIRKGFNIAQWFWQQLVENDFCSLKENALIYAFELTEEYDINLNQLCHIYDDQRQELFHGNCSHLLADTKGDLYQIRPYEQCTPSYDRLLNCVLDLGLSADKPNNHKITARQIASSVEEKYGQGQSIFKNFIEKYELKEKFKATLEPKNSKTKKQPL